MLRQDQDAGGKTGFFPLLITGLSWSFDWHSDASVWSVSGNWSIWFGLVWTCRGVSYRHMIIQWRDYHPSCWLSSNVMALGQSSELWLILGAGCGRAGDIKESDTSRKMESEELPAVSSSGLGGGRSACSAACPNRVRCVCEQQSDGEWCNSITFTSPGWDTRS